MKIESEHFDTMRVKFKVENPRILFERMRITSAVPIDVVEKEIPDYHRYEPDAVVPLLHKRRKLTPEEEAQVQDNLLANPTTPTSLRIEFVQMPPAVDHVIQTKGSSVDPDELNTVLNHSLNGPPIEMNGFVPSLPDQTTVATIDPAIMHASEDSLQHVWQRPGIHVDNWHKRTLAKRADSPRRLCYNLGPGKKQILIVMPDIIGMAEELNLAETEIPRTRHLREYTKKTEGLPCFTIDLFKEEAYILPAEVAGHDGAITRESQGSTMAMWPWTSEREKLIALF